MTGKEMGGRGASRINTAVVLHSSYCIPHFNLFVKTDEL